tara:strand:- start:56 stop:376 length:321 start_codon:yes stop_codon:yes gene_type:complete
MIEVAEFKRAIIPVKTRIVEIPNALRDHITEGELGDFLEQLMVDTLLELGVIRPEENTVSVHLSGSADGRLLSTITLNKLETKREFTDRIDEEITKLEDLKNRFPF